MNKVKRRAMSALLVAVLVLGGIGVYIVRYIEHGAEWATFAANSSVYTSGVLSTGTLTDRSGVVLATANGGPRSYADDAAVRLRDLAAILADAAERGRCVQTQARRILHHDKYAAICAALFAHDGISGCPIKRIP